MLFVVGILSIILGVALISLSHFWVITVIAKDPRRKYQGFPNLPLTQVMKIIGFVLILVGIIVFLVKNDVWPWRTLMVKGTNRIALLENGAITKGQVVKVFYQEWAPSGWRLDYNFFAEDPCTQEIRAYVGSAQGPKKYYAHLSEGDPQTIIYWPVKPEVNCEIRYFLNDPSYRWTFKKAGKLKLLDKFRNKYEIEDYSTKGWCELMWQK